MNGTQQQQAMQHDSAIPAASTPPADRGFVQSHQDFEKEEVPVFPAAELFDR